MTAALRTQTGVLVEQVVRRFGDRVVLDHLDLVIDDDELVVLLWQRLLGRSASECVCYEKRLVWSANYL